MAKRKSIWTGKGYRPYLHCPKCQENQPICHFTYKRKVVIFCEICATNLGMVENGNLKPIPEGFLPDGVLPESPSNAAARAEFEADPLQWEAEAMAHV